MSWQAMTAVSHHSKQDGCLLRLILRLAEGADKNGAIDPAPNQTTLAEFFDCTPRTIRNRINTLCSTGELTQTRVGKGPGNASAYQINLKLPETSSEIPETETGKPETNPANVSGNVDEIAEIKAEIALLKAEIALLKAEKPERKGQILPELKPEKPETKTGKTGKISANTGKTGNENRKGYSFKNADDPLLIRNDQREREKPSLSHDKQALADMVNALAEVAVMDGHANWHILSQASQGLLGHYTADQIRIYYGRDQADNGRWNWYLHDWRGQKGELPTPKGITETIKRAVTGTIPVQTNQANATAPSAGMVEVAPGVY